MLNDVTTTMDNVDKSNVIANYDAFVAVNKKNGTTLLYFLAGVTADGICYLCFSESGSSTPFIVDEDELFSAYFKDNYVVYNVDKTSVKFNDISYKRKI